MELDDFTPERMISLSREFYAQYEANGKTGRTPYERANDLLREPMLKGLDIDSESSELLSDWIGYKVCIKEIAADESLTVCSEKVLEFVEINGKARTYEVLLKLKGMMEDLRKQSIEGGNRMPPLNNGLWDDAFVNPLAQRELDIMYYIAPYFERGNAEILRDSLEKIISGRKARLETASEEERRILEEKITRAESLMSKYL